MELLIIAHGNVYLNKIWRDIKWKEYLLLQEV